MLGLSKSFVIFIFISIIIGYGTRSWKIGLVMISTFIVIKITWRFLTHGRKNKI